MSARAGIVVTGTEVLTGRIQDRNGPWLSDRLLELGVELAHITICGDRPEDIDAQLRFLADQDVDLILTSGGLGPTADDMTVEMVARFCERELVLDDELEEKIAGILKPLMARFSHWDFDAVRAANRKQALVPEGAFIIDPVGTAPGVVVPGKPTVVVLPGPPRELQPMWRTAVNTDAVLEAIAGRTTYLHETVRMFGLPESGLADTLRDAEEGIAGFEALEITTCLRRGEIEMVTRYEPDAADVYAELVSLVRERHGREIFSDDGSRVDDLVAQLLAGRRVATAESCTSGLLAARLTERPGSSAYVAGGVVAYANEAKVELLDVDPQLIEEHGAVSEPVAEAMAEGALKQFGADTAVAITGIAGPDGGTEEKPVGTVCWSVRLDGRSRDHADGAAAGRQGGHPRPLDHRRDAPVAAPALRVSGPRARLFLALDLPEPARASLASWRDTLVADRSDLRPVSPEALHVTLVFLGWQDESAAPKIADAAFGALPAGRPPRLTPVGVRSLPPRNPRLFALDLEDEGGRAAALQASASAALEAGGWYRPEKRPFWPHLTLARVKRRERRVAPLPDASAAAERAVRGACRDPVPLHAAPPRGALRAAGAYLACGCRRFPSRTPRSLTARSAYEPGRRATPRRSQPPARTRRYRAGRSSRTTTKSDTPASSSPAPPPTSRTDASWTWR